MFSKACEYAIKSVTFIASESLNGNRVNLDDISKSAGSPRAFTAKVLRKLTLAKIVQAYKGPNGGTEISQERMKEIKLKDIVFAIDGDSVYAACAMGLAECNDNRPCPMHHKFFKVRKELKEMLEGTSVYELAQKFKSGDAVLIQ